MIVRIFGCKKFSRLLSERDDRDLAVSEERFLERHRVACVDCRRSERTSESALNMLRAASLEPEIAPMFEDRVIRKLKVQTVKESLNYWSPALVGAGIACIALFVALHLAASPAQLNKTEVTTGEAERYIAPATKPNLDLVRIPEFNK